MFLKRDKNSRKWTLEYDETIYKIYDRNNDLAGYFLPDYGFVDNQITSNGNDEEKDEWIIIEEMNKEHKEVPGGEVVLPLVKLDLLDIEDEHVDLDFAYGKMEEHLKRIDSWLMWMRSHSDRHNIINNWIYTSREDRNMLCIVLQLNSRFVLHKQDIILKLKPILDSLSEWGLL
ncbi:MAG TPA: hypothetical protein VE130_05045 [Nitrososphaeraceae archaeon]|nr:hypothetical protein [Nitrososphaeraceae archaeon]